MTLNLFGAMANRSESQTSRTAQNASLSRVFAALMARLIRECDKKHKSLDGLHFGPVTMTENRISARVSFLSFGMPSTPFYSERVSSFEAYHQKKQAALHALFSQRPEVAKLLDGIIRCMEGHAKDKGKDFARLHFCKAFISKDDVLVMELDP